MAISQENLLKKVSKLPSSPGVYKFMGNRKAILYIGKATSLKSRVRSYFASDIGEKRSELIKKMVGEAFDIQFEKTDSVLEALILEAELIKKHLPPYNSIGKDQRSWNYVVITDEKFPAISVIRGRELEQSDATFLERFGPFTNGGQLREALKIIRKIFPYRDSKCIPAENQTGLPKPCFNYQIGLCPGVCISKVTEREYKTTIHHIAQFFRGHKKQLVKELEKEMREHAKNREFEKAEEVKRKVFALKHIEDIALIKRDRPELQSPYSGKSVFRIESYDIAHISGAYMVGVMTVVENGEAKKGDYRMFKIRGQKTPDDTRALTEVLERRLKHTEWPKADLIVVDGGTAQLNAIKLILEERRIRTPLVAVTKDDRHKVKEIKNANTKSEALAKEHERSILLSNAESHRFAIAYHRKLRNKLF